MVSLLPILIAVVLLYSAYLCVSLCVCEYVFICVLLLFLLVVVFIYSAL